MDYFGEDDPNHNSHLGEITYPDIDETVQYPWQGSRQSFSHEASAIDPRLYKDLFSGGESQELAQSAADEEQSAPEEEQSLDLNNSDESSSFVASSEEETSLVLQTPHSK
jgi:general transcription factor 3C polypeptide 3 (transcription factor C subunit 4)